MQAQLPAIKPLPDPVRKLDNSVVILDNLSNIPNATDTHLYWSDIPFRELGKKPKRCYLGTEIPQRLCLHQQAAHKVYPWFGLTFQTYQCL